MENNLIECSRFTYKIPFYLPICAKSQDSLVKPIKSYQMFHSKETIINQKHKYVHWSKENMSREIEPLIVGRVIGDVLDMFNPSVTMRVTYNSNTIVSNGHELSPSLLLSKPRVEIGGQDLRSFFTLVRNYLSSKLQIYIC